MRKILLTTTALVALGGVSAASAIEISGSYGFTYTDTSNTGGSADAAGVSGDAFGNDTQIDFTNSITTDAGLTWGALYRVNGTPAIEDMGITVDGDFGRIMMGQTDGIVDGMDGFMLGSAAAESGGPGTTNNSALTYSLKTGAAVTDNATTGKVGYRSPEVSGFQFGASYEDAGSTAALNNDVMSFIVTYDFGVAKIGYASANVDSANDDGADSDQKHYGFGTSLMGADIAVGFGSEKTSATAVLGGQNLSKIDTRDISVAYPISDVASVYYNNVRSEEKSANGADAGDKLESQAYGVYYTIAPGVTSNLEWAESDYTDATAGSGNSDARTQMYGFIKVAF
ncbi:porin [Alphaproteobacteria bacterium]|nr:porin [Alphaproteobacteria bacterium]